MFDRALDPRPGPIRRINDGRDLGSRSAAREAMRKDGIPDACEVCGWSLPSCASVGDRGDLLCLHHIFPDALGGGYYSDNLALLCRNCHRVAHRLFRVVNNGYVGPVGRRAFLEEMRTFWLDPERWWKVRRRFVVGGWAPALNRTAGGLR